ncbi:MAG: fibronectin type III domain-containing protein, partial [Flavobacteriales bacterium]|nr:fibronectin type III domain-containing protein [Flavobacteriales bacterium]
MTNTGAGSGATITAVMFQSAGPANSLALKATASVFTGSADPRHSTAPAGAAGNGVYSATVASYGWYNSPVAIGFSPPTIANLVTSQGSGYTSAPTVTVSGGTLLSGTAITSSDFQVNVAGGRVISVYYIGPASKIYSVPPTITLTGGGGSGATISWGTAWPTATVNLSNGTSGYITGITITNPGYGYATAPSVGLRAPVAGEVAASSPSCRLQQLNIQWGFFLPQTTNPNNSSIMALVPSHNRVNAIAVSSGAQTFTSNLEVTASAPLPTFAGIIDMGGGNNLRFSHPTYAGTPGTVNAYVTNGSVELSLPGGIASATRTFPIGGGTGATAHFVHVTGAGTVTTGYTYTGVRVQRFSNPSGSVSPAGNITGIRGVRVDLTGVGALNNLNSTRTMQMFWNVLDNLVSNNPSLFIADATSPSGPWTIRSTSTGTGALPATGNRTTATGAPGPYADNPTMYFAWVNNGFTPPPPLQYNVVRSTGITYQSIAPAPIGDGTGLNTTFSSGDDAVSPVINLNVPGNAFTFQGETVTGFVISTNGNIQLHTASAATTSTAFTNSFNDNALLNVIAPFWDDLTANPNTAAGASQNIFYKITGTAPNRTLVVEWLNFTTFGAAGPQLNFQIEMEEATGIIRINYGDIQLFNGTNDHRYSYSCGLKGRFASAYPQPGQVLALGYENSNYWSHTRTQTANLGANGLLMSPEPRSRYTFTPGPGYVLPPIPTITPPANDDVNNAEPITALGAFPNNIAWNVPDNKPRIYTTRGATTSPQPFCAGPSDAKDVWFSFVATEPNVTARIYASGGFIPRAQLLDNSLNTIDCQVGPKGGVVDVVGTGLTIGATYYVRVYHNQTGNPAIFTANNVVNGNVTGVSINDGGSGYSFATTGQILGNRFDVSGGGGVTFVGAATTQSGGAITGGQFDGGNDYTSVPTITVEDPDWALTGQFAIVIYAPPVNDNCSGAIALTGINTNTCTTGTNQVVNVSTAAATPSSEPLGTCTAGADDDLWYTFTATGNMTNIQVQGNGGFDPALQIWTGTSCTSKSPVTSPAGGCVNATGANGLENVNLTTTPGTTYWVRVYHAGTGFGGPLANFSICVRTPTPNCATGFSPVSGTTEVPGSLTLSWNADPFATGYDVYLSTNQADVNAQNPAALVSSNQPGTTYNATGLTAGATYYWRIVPRNVNGSATGCSTLSFTVGSNSCTFISYPQIFASSTADEEITNVTVGSMNNSSTCATVAPGFGSIQNRYSNYAGHVTPHTGIQGSTVNFSLTQTTCGGNFSNGFQMYIDWNEDGDFLDAGEQVYN